MPRLSSTGLPALADGLEQPEVGHVAGADLQHVGVLGDDLDVARVDDLGDDRQPGDLADVGEDLQALHAQALEGVRRGARLERAAAQQRGAGGLGHLGRLERLLGCLDRARTGDEGERVRADRDLVPGRPTWTVERSGWCCRLTSLNGSEIRCTSCDAGHAAQVEAVEGLDVADQADDRAHDAAADERLAARLLDALGRRARSAPRWRRAPSPRPWVEARPGCPDGGPISPASRPHRAGQTAMCVTSASILRRGTSSTISMAASTSAPPRSIRTVADSPPSSTAKKRGEDRLHAHDDRRAGRWQVGLCPRLAEQRGGAGEHRHVDDREPVGGRSAGSTIPPGAAATVQITAITMHWTIDMPSASRAFDQAPSPTMCRA